MKQTGIFALVFVGGVVVAAGATYALMNSSPNDGVNLLAQCPAERPVLCPDGTCATAASACAPLAHTPEEPHAADNPATTTDRAQNHNSSRSNRTSAATVDDSDTDEDGYRDTTEVRAAPTNYNNPRSNRATIATPATTTSRTDALADVEAMPAPTE